MRWRRVLHRASVVIASLWAVALLVLASLLFSSPDPSDLFVWKSTVAAGLLPLALYLGCYWVYSGLASTPQSQTMDASVRDIEESAPQTAPFVYAARSQWYAEGIEHAARVVDASFDETSEKQEPLESRALEHVCGRVRALVRVVKESQTRELFHATTGAVLQMIRENDELRDGIRNLAQGLEEYSCAKAQGPAGSACEDQDCPRCSALAWVDQLNDRPKPGME